MANNVALLPENAGRVTAPSLAYPFGSAKDDSTGSTGDGMPVKIAYFNDSFGMQQALLRAAGLTPTGSADTALSSQYLQSIIQIAAGRATQYDDTGGADSYVLALRSNQQAPGGLFDGLTVEFTPNSANTGPSGLDISALLGQTAGTTVLNVKTYTGGELLAGDISGRTTLVYDLDANEMRIKGPSNSALTGVSALEKSDPATRALEISGVTLRTAQTIKVTNSAGVFTFAAGALVALPTLVNASDYIVYCLTNGTLSAQPTDDAAPAGASVLGGFHAAYSNAAMVPASIWDIKFRPSCDPRAMVLSPDGRVWVDIYLADIDYGLNKYSRPDVTIADGGSAPKIPAMYGGNGTDTYGSLTWFEAWDLAINAGKRLPLWGEFTGFAFGVVEQQAVGTDPVTTRYQAGHRSACGVEQVTGAMWQWGADVQGSGTGWSAITDGRGSVYSSSLSAVILGAHWDSGSVAGSRSADWSGPPSRSSASIGMRAVCDHQLL